MRKLTKAQWRARQADLQRQKAVLEVQAEVIRANARAALQPINQQLNNIAKQLWHCEQALSAPSTDPTLAERLNAARQAIKSL